MEQEQRFSFKAFVREFTPKSWTSLRTYSFSSLRSDIGAGIAIGFVALPLAMAFAIASGLSPAAGIYTAIVGGFLAALFGGTRFQITGPTGSFVVIVYSIMQSCGYEGLVISTILAGVILIIVGLSKGGSLIKYIPYPLITGIITGMAVMVFSSQIKDFLGLQIEHVPANFIPKCLVLFKALPTWNPLNTFVATASLGIIIAVRRFYPAAPWGIISIGIATLLTSLFGIPIETVASRYGNIPTDLPSPTLPDFSVLLSNWYLLFQSAITIAFLAGVEALLSAVVADGMTGRSHRSNCELVGQGIANIGSVLFGGIPTTGSLSRTALNIKSGAKSPFAGMFHSLTILLILYLFSPLVNRIPLATLAAVIVMIAWNMSEIKHFRQLFSAPSGDITVLLTAFFLTVFVDLIVAIEVGMVLASFLFMKRVRDLSGVHALKVINEQSTSEPEKVDPDAIEKRHIPQGVEVYEITGLFFFQLAENLKNILSHLNSPPKVFILRMRKIPVLDASGLHALKEFHISCSKKKITLLLSGVGGSAYKQIERFGLIELIGKENIFSHIDPTLTKAAQIIEASMPKPEPTPQPEPVPNTPTEAPPIESPTIIETVAETTISEDTFSENLDITPPISDSDQEPEIE